MLRGRGVFLHGEAAAVTRHCEPTGPREVARPDDRLREAIQRLMQAAPGLLPPTRSALRRTQTHRSSQSERRRVVASLLAMTRAPRPAHPFDSLVKQRWVVMAGLVPAISIQLARLCHGYRDRRVKPGDDGVVGRSRDASASELLFTKGKVSQHERSKKKEREAKRRKARTTHPHHRVRCVLSGGRSPSGASPRRLSRRSTARNSVQAALHAMKCEGITSAFSHRA